ncbi:MAG: O-antigen ligase family protein [Frankia sp.]
MGATKWGAHLGIGPIFLTDILLACAALTQVRQRTEGRFGVSAVLLAFFAYCCVRFATGPHSLTALRDFTPYGYAAVAVLPAAAAVAGKHVRDRSVRLLSWALAFHLIWVTMAVAVPSAVAAAPQLGGFGGAGIFRVRTDVDMAVLGVTAALYLWRYAAGGARRHVLGVVWCVAVAARMNSRAGFIALVLVLATTFFLTVTRPAPGNRRTLVLVGAAPALVVGLLVAIPLTVGGGKLTASLGLTPASSEVDRSGINTARGREQAWTDVRQWTADQHARTLGVGFGRNFLAESGALVPLGSNPDLRSPHNYFIGTYARLGLVGVGLFVLLLGTIVRDAWAVTRGPVDDLALLAILTPPALVAVATFGVVLESPFGAVPFFWFVGILAADARRVRSLRAARSVSALGGPGRGATRGAYLIGSGSQQTGDAVDELGSQPVQVWQS